MQKQPGEKLLVILDFLGVFMWVSHYFGCLSLIPILLLISSASDNSLTFFDWLIGLGPFLGIIAGYILIFFIRHIGALIVIVSYLILHFLSCVGRDCFSLREFQITLLMASPAIVYMLCFSIRRCFNQK